ncbi:MAG: hypothetical protein WCF96_05910 [Eubacteriales bacterium]
MVFSKMPLTKLQLHYFEYKLLRLETTFDKPLLFRLLPSRKKLLSKKMEVMILGNGTTGSVALVESHPDLVAVDLEDDSCIQYAYCPEENMIANAKKLALRVLHRMRGGMPSVEEIETTSVFRPFWVAYYGEVVPGNKVRYKTIAADGCSSQRSF